MSGCWVNVRNKLTKHLNIWQICFFELQVFSLHHLEMFYWDKLTNIFVVAMVTIVKPALSAASPAAIFETSY